LWLAELELVVPPVFPLVTQTTGHLRMTDE
jgi:hypothetical protein